MPITPAQEKKILDNLMSWGDLDEETQKRITLQVKGDFISIFEEFDPIDLPTEFIKPAKSAQQEAENNCTPWFYIEILLKTVMPIGETVEQCIDKQVKERCESAVYYPSDKLDFTLECI